MSLYNKYRPDTIEQMKGNENVLQTLDKMLSNINGCPHSFLLTGPTGCGKTTLGRIIANRLNCTGTDFREVDSADFRGIDTIREIRKNTQYKPLESDCRVWLIDECHKLTNDAQNALLKILEDTPSHVYFILCTTEPEKLLPTLKNRCQQFVVKQLEESELYIVLRKIVRAEKQELEKDVYDQIIQDSLGHPRNAIQILERVLNCPVEDRLDIAKQAALETSESIDLCRALINGEKWMKVKGILEGLKQMEPESIRRHVLGYAQSVLLKSDNVRAAAIIESFWEPTYNIGFPGIVYMSYNCVK